MVDLSRGRREGGKKKGEEGHPREERSRVETDARGVSRLESGRGGGIRGREGVARCDPLYTCSLLLSSGKASSKAKEWVSVTLLRSTYTTSPHHTGSISIRLLSSSRGSTTKSRCTRGVSVVIKKRSRL